MDSIQWSKFPSLPFVFPLLVFSSPKRSSAAIDLTFHVSAF
jgi:hypothetical protein